VGVSQRDVDRLQGQGVNQLAPVGGVHIGRGRKNRWRGGTRPGSPGLKRRLRRRRGPRSTPGRFGAGGRGEWPPSATSSRGVKCDACGRKCFLECFDGVDFPIARKYAALGLKSSKP
jgi:hypothetical protein